MKTLISVKDIQATLGLGKSAVYSLIHEKSFPSPIALNSRTLRWDSEDFAKWLESKKTPLKDKKKISISPKEKVFIINGVRFRKSAR